MKYHEEERSNPLFLFVEKKRKRMQNYVDGFNRVCYNVV